MERTRTQNPASAARLHSVLRFGIGTAAGFVLSEVMGWYPTFLAPLFTAILLANLPTALSGKAGVALIIVQGCAAYSAAILATFLHETPFVVFGIVGVVLFTCFANLTRGRGMLPILLVLIAFASIPIVAMVAPQQAGAVSLAFTRSLAVAVCVVWVAHALWPKMAELELPAPMAALDEPVMRAVAGTAIVLPLMLVYLMYGITDALPVLITTVILVTTFDPRRGATQWIAMMIGNFIGGMTAVAALALLQLVPDLATLWLVSFLIGIMFGSRVERGGPGAAIALLSYNQTMVMFGLALIPGGADTGLWMARLFQFAIAGMFAVGMMTLLLPRRRNEREIAESA